MAADHRIGQIEIFDHGLQLALVLLGHFAPEDHGDLLGLADGSVQIQQSLGEFIYRGAAMEDEVVAILHLREEQPMLTSSLFAFPVCNERGERREPLLAALQQVLSGERVGEFLQARRIAALQECVGALLEVDALFPHANRQPVVLVEAHPCRKWKIGAHAYEHPAPVRVIQVEVKLVHPALLVLQMGAVVVLVSDSHQDASRFPRFQDRHDLVGFGILEVRFHELVAPALVTVAIGRFENRSAPFLGSVLQPILKLIGDFRQSPLGHPFPLAVGIEKTKHSLGLLEGLNQSVEQNAIEATIAEADAILVVFDKGVHGNLQCGEIPGAYSHGRLCVYVHAETSRPKLSRPAGMAQSPRVRAGRVWIHGWFSQTGNLRSGVADAARGSLGTGQYRRRFSPARQGRQSPIHELGGGLAGRVPLLPDPGSGSEVRRHFETGQRGGGSQPHAQRLRRRHSGS